ncbi:MAG TPA: hypothetical protein EYH07_18845 [Kiloniellaceae bacterium]|nr:hypothetical protein [Kiloniellaceae bacterium]HIP80505.1 hypothetical protein [Kiloniellaceae bacterium]
MKKLLAFAFVALLALGNTSLWAVAKDLSLTGQQPELSGEPFRGLTSEGAVIDRLCPPPFREIDVSAFRFLRDRLGGVDLSAELLSAIEASLLRAAEVCNTQTSERTGLLLAGLLESVAGHRWNHGELLKADSAFQIAFEISHTESVPLLRIGILTSWAHLKVDLGDSWSARELIDLQAQIVEDHFDKKPQSPVRISHLVHALRDQAYLYDVIGLSREAAALNQRAAAMEAGLPPCDSGCIYTD